MSLQRQISNVMSGRRRKIALIGLGLHAQRIYYPLLAKYGRKLNVELSLVVDLKSARSSIVKYLEKYVYQPKEMLFLCDEGNKPGKSQIPDDHHKPLYNLIKKHDIDGVIIATEPLVHKMYANFFLRNNISILMDKPITIRENVISNLHAAKGLFQDYLDLKETYLEGKRKNPFLCFIILAQRRFHPAYVKLCQLIEEISQRVNIPITSIHSYHCDGEHRTPFEIADQSYHSYNQGYGKVGHSGYHCLDILQHLVRTSYASCSGKDFDSIKVNSTMVRPLDLIGQYTIDDYKSLYGEKAYEKLDPYHSKEKELEKILAQCGEVDSFVQLRYMKDKKIITMATANLQHNGFSNRSWLSNKGRNLYKGNGRVRHESHVIQQGPFQSLHLHSYQSIFDTTQDSDKRYVAGGVDHLDVTVYRNPHVATSDVGTFSKFSIKDLETEYMSGYSHGHQENSRALGFFAFVDCLHGQTGLGDASDFLSHELSTRLISNIYESHILSDTVVCKIE